VKKILLVALGMAFGADGILAQNVGIGTTNPQDRLDVAGSIRSNGLRLAGNNSLDLGFGVAGKETNAGRIGYGLFTANTVDFIGGGTNPGDRRIRFWAEGGTSFTGGASFLGNVGLSVASNTLGKLQVNGRGGTPFSIGMLDSATNAAGALLFANVNRPASGLALRGSSFGAGADQNNLSISSYDGNSLFMTVRGDGNVGIGTSSALNDKLTVAGDMNLTGKLKLNSDAGKAGNVLVLSQSGNPSWSSLNQGYKFSRVITATGAQTFNIPAGVTEILVEQWGAGGGGSSGGGGGSGTYSAYLLDVSGVVSISINNGTGGAPAVGTNDAASNGNASTVTLSSTVFQTSGGFGAGRYDVGKSAVSVVYNPQATPVLLGFRCEAGQSGKPRRRFAISEASCSFDQFGGGDGGDSPISNTTGGTGGVWYSQFCSNLGTSLRIETHPSTGTYGSGGGGGPYSSNNDAAFPTSWGSSGGNGRTIIWW
jgi:hypothetical protein